MSEQQLNCNVANVEEKKQKEEETNEFSTLPFPLRLIGAIVVVPIIMAIIFFVVFPLIMIAIFFGIVWGAVEYIAYGQIVTGKHESNTEEKNESV